MYKCTYIVHIDYESVHVCTLYTLPVRYRPGQTTSVGRWPQFLPVFSLNPQSKFKGTAQTSGFHGDKIFYRHKMENYVRAHKSVTEMCVFLIMNDRKEQGGQCMIRMWEGEDTTVSFTASHLWTHRPLLLNLICCVATMDFSAYKRCFRGSFTEKKKVLTNVWHTPQNLVESFQLLTFDFCCTRNTRL